MLDGVMLLWFILTAMSVVYVAIDIRWTPEAIVLKWGFVILTLFTGPFGAFFYVLGCREPLPGTHEQYVSATWRQVLGSTMHCAAGDGLGIFAGAIVGSLLHVSTAADIALEYVCGFAFGWAFFQAYAMRDMAGGDYLKSLRMTFIPELFSMNCLMGGMILVSKFWMPAVEGAGSPLSPAFWFIMSIALLAGFVCAYPMNWWLVTRNLKHGMMTVRVDAMEKAAHSEPGQDMGAMGEMPHGDRKDYEGHGRQDGRTESGGHDEHSGHDEHGEKPSTTTTFAVGAFSVVFLAATVAIVLMS